ncbi:phosphoadenosine phosphosulfate reductase family protein [uncultured Methanoregula sp.]|uniref:phosphoadenosine phosphosulfate reductase domain-containing protein n=1 Tax=uncultured Methanoregula sp. TaxID=1005933 RepID=UPI002AAC2C38|nr:phosphoadenosine phosphosulfate reductase family protein [uncultured Methanoregula sp.]
MRPSYLGKILLRWCDACHTPVLARQCSCGNETREVPVTPPGDARPAFPDDVALVNHIYEEHFGAPLIPPGHIALLNKVPDNDRMEEVIVGGGVAGIIRYFPDRREWEPVPRPEAGNLFTPKKRFIVVSEDAVPFIRDQGMSVLAPGVISVEEHIRAGDEVFILAPDGKCIGVGRAKVDAATARGMVKGQVVRTRRNIASIVVPGSATWEDAVLANSDVLERAESEAVQFVRDVAGRNQNLQPNISYSGGKDSLATLLVVTKAIGKVPMLFADTGLEFPETYANVDEVAEKYGLEVLRTDGITTFWENFSRQGPPAVNARWCCKVCKLTPVGNLIREKWGECLSFIGQRRYESATRAQSDRVWRNSNVRVQLSAAPIHNWTALHVWLYIQREHAPYNILYERHLDRIGCFMCPSSDMALIHMIAEKYPGLWQAWTANLETYRQSAGLPEEWISDGKWRLREDGKDDADSHY